MLQTFWTCTFRSQTFCPDILVQYISPLAFLDQDILDLDVLPRDILYLDISLRTFWTWTFRTQDISPPHFGLDVSHPVRFTPDILDMPVSPPDFLDLDILLPDIPEQDVSDQDLLDLDISPRHLHPGCFIPRLFSSPVQSTRRAICPHPRSRHTATKFYFQVFQKFISRQPLIRKLSYLDHRYPGGPAFIPYLLTPGLMPRGGARGQNLGHL